MDRYIVVDGKFITTNQLEVNGAGPAAKAHVIFGWMRDDGADFVGSLPTASTTLTSALLGSGCITRFSSLISHKADVLHSLSFNITNAVVNSPLFPTPSGSDPLKNLYNLTSRVGTDGQFRRVERENVDNRLTKVST